MGRNLELAFVSIRPLNGTNLPVVRGILIRCVERKCRFQIGGESLPIDCIAKLHAIAAISCCKTHGLNKLRAFGLASDFERDTNGATLLNSNVGGPAT